MTYRIEEKRDDLGYYTIDGYVDNEPVFQMRHYDRWTGRDVTDGKVELELKWMCGRRVGLDGDPAEVAKLMECVNAVLKRAREIGPEF